MNEAQREEIRMLALGVPVGEQSGHLLCPMCNGGSKREKSFVIWRTRTAVLYKCYRGTCTGSGGTIESVAQSWDPSPKVREVRRYQGTVDLLSRFEIEYCLKNWYLTEEVLSSQRIKRDQESSRLHFPLFSLDGYETGCILRSIRGEWPKVISYFESEVYPPIHFPLGPAKWALGEAVIVVEDIPSAIRIQNASQFQGCALLGTHLSHTMVDHLSTHFKDLYLCLDSDATVRSVKFLREYGLMFRNFHVVVLSKDIKNMTPTELQQFVQELP